MKKALIRTLQAVFTIGILIWVFHSPEKRAQMATAFSQADGHWLLIGLPVALAGEIANITRWKILLRVQGMHLSWPRTAQLFFVGLFFNLFMPGYTGGDFARLYFSMREFPDRKKEAILTIVMDRLIGMLALVVAAVVTTGLRWQWLQQTPQASFLLLILLCMLVGFTVITVGSFLVSGLKLANRLPRHTPFRERLIETSEAYHVFARAKVPLLCHVSFLDMITIMPIVTCIISLPITPGGVGFRESLFEILLRDLCKVPGEVAVLISLLGFSYFVLFGLVGGICYLFYSPRGRARWREMQGEVERVHSSRPESDSSAAPSHENFVDRRLQP